MKKLKIEKLREEKGWSQAQLGKKVGVSERTIRTWESDIEHVRNAKGKHLLKLCKVFKITLDQII